MSRFDGLVQLSVVEALPENQIQLCFAGKTLA
jgi:hypothetical protein